MTLEPDGSGALANVLGALALVVTDEMGRAVASAAHDRSTTDATALAALAEFLDGSTLDRLHQVLGLTPSGAVRLVDRLAEADLAVRDAGSDGRSRAVRLTEAGHERARNVRAARAAYLSSLTAGLTDDDVAELRRLLGLVMANVVAGKDGGAWTCRLCDLVACRRPQGECPAMNAAQEKFGSARSDLAEPQD